MVYPWGAMYTTPQALNSVYHTTGASRRLTSRKTGRAGGWSCGGGSMVMTGCRALMMQCVTGACLRFSLWLLILDLADDTLHVWVEPPGAAQPAGLLAIQQVGQRDRCVSGHAGLLHA